MGWYDTTFKEYVQGMNAGEKSCALGVAWCYLNEEGTSRNIKKAISILEKYSEKDAAISLFLALFYDPTYINGDLYLGEAKFEKIGEIYPLNSGGYGFRRFYNYFSPLHSETFGIPYDINKSIKYAEKANKKLNSIGSKTYLKKLRQHVQKNSNDYLKVLSSYDGSESFYDYESTLEKCIEQSKSLEDISKIIHCDSLGSKKINASDETIAFEYNRSYYEQIDNCAYLTSHSEQTKVRELLAEKTCSLYVALWKENNHDIKKLISIYNEGKIKTAIDVGVLLYAKIKGYNNTISEDDLVSLEWLCNNCPYESINNKLKVIWTRAKLRTLISNNKEWHLFENVFSSKNYYSVDGIAPRRYNGRGLISTKTKDYLSFSIKGIVVQ
jgi:hypothetical protein